MDYFLFKQAYLLLVNLEYLTPEGLRQIISIKASINNGLSIVLKEAFPVIKPAPTFPFFLKYPILGIKALDLKDFCFILSLTKNNVHHSKVGLNQIVQIKANMNSGRDE